MLEVNLLPLHEGRSDPMPSRWLDVPGVGEGCCAVWVAGAALGIWGGTSHGWLLAPLAFMAGPVATVLLFLVERRYDAWRATPRPRCWAGPCGPDDYDLVAPANGGGCVWVCRCGHRYVERHESFAREVGEGVELPYMESDLYGGWRAATPRSPS